MKLKLMVFFWGLVCAPAVLATGLCSPYFYSIGDSFVGCDALQKTSTWRIFWPDQTDETVYASGDGVCTTTLTCCDPSPHGLECWPEFLTPMGCDGSWSQVVYDGRTKNVYDSCVPGCDGINKTACKRGTQIVYSVYHTCP